MAKDVEVTINQPEEQPVEQEPQERFDEDIEIVVGEQEQEEDPAYAKVSKADIIKKLKEVESKAGDSSQAITQGLAQVGDRLAQAVQRPAMLMPQRQAPDPRANMDEMRKRHEEKFQTDPVQATTDILGELLVQKVIPAINTRLSGAGAGVAAFARKDLLRDEQKGETAKKYIGEIDQIVGAMSPDAKNNPEVYEQAYKLVVSQHVDEVIDAAVERRLKEKGVGTERAGVPHRETGRNSPAGNAIKKVTIRLTQDEADKMRAEADRKGIDFEDYVAFKKGGKRG